MKMCGEMIVCLVFILSFADVTYGIGNTDSRVDAGIERAGTGLARSRSSASNRTKRTRGAGRGTDVTRPTRLGAVNGSLSLSAPLSLYTTPLYYSTIASGMLACGGRCGPQAARETRPARVRDGAPST